MSCWPGRGNEFQLFTAQSAAAAAAAALRKVMEPVVQIRLTACSRVRLEKLVKKFPEFMEPECSWRCSQQPVSFLHSQTDPAHAIPFDFLRSILMLHSHLRVGSPSYPFSSGSPSKTCTHLPALCKRATWRASLISGEEQKSRSSSLCSSYSTAHGQMVTVSKKDQFADRHGCCGHLHPAPYFYAGKTPLAPYVSRPNKICLSYLKRCQ